ncbi:hypothetical protein MPSEU_000731400 [Mayamaea pseudoterrestris]|nr:hypothetical protein MPSEU_000731400 [Mayamaea pseudoterrestris]
MSESEPVFSFASLKLVHYPSRNDGSDNGGALEASIPPQDLRDCSGYLKELPIRCCNADARKPESLVDMVNILASNPHTQALFDQEIKRQEMRAKRAAAAAIANGSSSNRQDKLETDGSNTTVDPLRPHSVYDYESSDIMTEAIKVIKHSCCHVHGPAGHSVAQGCISFYKHNGTTYAAGPGKWLLMSLKAKWIAKNVPVNQQVIVAGSVFMVQIPLGSIGRIRYQGSHVLLASGTHVFNAGSAVDDGTITLDTPYWSHGNYHAIRVKQGQLAKVHVERVASDGTRSIQPRFLKEGEHFIESHLFKFDDFVSDHEPYIQHGSIHKVSVDKGLIAKVWEQGNPRLLGEGEHFITASSFKYLETVPLSNMESIVHGTITILRIPLGKIALAWKDMEPIFITKPGLHEYNSSDFTFVEMRDSAEPVITLGSKTRVVVHTGQVAVTYDSGKLQILADGHHLLEGSNHVFQRFLSTQQKPVRLKTHKSLQEPRKIPKKGGILKTVAFPTDLESCSFAETKRREQELMSTTGSIVEADETVKDADEDLALVVSETKDLVRVGVRADVLYSIVDPGKLVEKANPDKLEDIILDTSVSVLTNIIRSTALYQMAKWTHVQAADEPPRIKFLDPLSSGDDAPPGEAGDVNFFQQLQDKFASQLKESFLNEYGVRLAELQIMSFVIMDEELAEQIAKHALTTAQLENKVSHLEAKAKVFMAEEHTASEVKRIAAVADRNAQKFRAEAKNERDIETARAKAEMTKITELANAQVVAESMIIRAKAEAEAMRIRTLAEAERAELLSRTTLGRQLALMDRYAEMVIESRRGMPALPYDSHSSSPFGALSPAIVSSELRSLERMAPPRSNGSRTVTASTALTTCTAAVTDSESRSRRSSQSSRSSSGRRSRSVTSRSHHDHQTSSSGDSSRHRQVRRSRSSGR